MRSKPGSRVRGRRLLRPSKRGRARGRASRSRQVRTQIKRARAVVRSRKGEGREKRVKGRVEDGDRREGSRGVARNLGLLVSVPEPFDRGGPAQISPPLSPPRLASAHPKHNTRPRSKPQPAPPCPPFWHSLTPPLVSPQPPPPAPPLCIGLVYTSIQSDLLSYSCTILLWPRGSPERSYGRASGIEHGPSDPSARGLGAMREPPEARPRANPAPRNSPPHPAAPAQPHAPGATARPKVQKPPLD